MDTDQRLDALIAPLRADVVSGASVVGRMAAEVLREAAMYAQTVLARGVPFGVGRDMPRRCSTSNLRWQRWSRSCETCSPPVEASTDLETGRQDAVRAAEAFGSGLKLRAESVATRAAALIPSGRTVATISSSSTVRATFAGHRGIR